MNESPSLSHLPDSPGVYLMRNNKAHIIYVGKANSLRKRVASYFQKQDHAFKIAILVQEVRHIDYIPTASEREALLLEQKLIRKLLPVYNTMWRDDKSYPYIKVTWNEEYPRLFLTRHKKPDGGHYFGPFPHVYTMKRFLRALWLKKPFTLRPCRFEFFEADIAKGLENSKPALYKKVKSCLYLHTGECPAPCVGKISRTDYAELVKKAETIFKANPEALKKQLELEMRSASKNLDFERAGLLRDEITALTHVAEPVSLKQVEESDVVENTTLSLGLTQIKEALHLPKPPIRIEAFDNSNIQGTNPVASMVVFERGVPKKSDYRKFKIKTVVGANDFASMEEVVFRRYKRLAEESAKFPDLILIDGGKGQLSSALAAYQKLKKSGYKVPALFFVGLAKQNEELFLPEKSEPIVLSKDSPGLNILRHIRDEAHRFAIAFHRQRRQKQMLQGDEHEQK